MENGRNIQVARRVRAYIEEKGLSREGFAHRAGISLSSVNNVVRGIFSEKLLDKVEANTGERFRSAAVVARQALAKWGSYDYEDVRHYEGRFELVRRSIRDASRIDVYCMTIQWHEEAGGLAIIHQAVGGSSKQQIGVLSFPKDQSFVFIAQEERGWQQLSILQKIDFRRTMAGAMLTLGNVGHGGYEPRVLPFCLIGHDAVSQTRYLLPGQATYDRYGNLVDKAASAMGPRFNGFASG